MAVIKQQYFYALWKTYYSAGACIDRLSNEPSHFWLQFKEITNIWFTNLLYIFIGLLDVQSSINCNLVLILRFDCTVDGCYCLLLYNVFGNMSCLWNRLVPFSDLECLQAVLLPWFIWSRCLIIKSQFQLRCCCGGKDSNWME